MLLLEARGERKISLNGRCVAWMCHHQVICTHHMMTDDAVHSTAYHMIEHYRRTTTYTFSLLNTDGSVDTKLESVATSGIADQVDINFNITLVELLLRKEQLQRLPAAVRGRSNAAGLPEVHLG